MFRELCWWKWVGPMCIEGIRLDQGHCPVARLLLSVAVPTFKCKLKTSIKKHTLKKAPQSCTANKIKQTINNNIEVYLHKHWNVKFNRLWAQFMLNKKWNLRKRKNGKHRIRISNAFVETKGHRLISTMGFWNQDFYFVQSIWWVVIYWVLKEKMKKK
jgi:hypothetical protein